MFLSFFWYVTFEFSTKVAGRCLDFALFLHAYARYTLTITIQTGGNIIAVSERINPKK